MSRTVKKEPLPDYPSRPRSGTTTPVANTDPWVHDEMRDGAGCCGCGEWAQVNDHCLCRECWS